MTYGGKPVFWGLKQFIREFPPPSFLSRIGVRDDGSGIQGAQDWASPEGYYFLFVFGKRLGNKMRAAPFIPLCGTAL